MFKHYFKVSSASSAAHASPSGLGDAGALSGFKKHAFLVVAAPAK
tara:strand:+ start:76 stop:210 length:135 start_codon:yes stop_codon:yes gene_type:complete